MTTTPDAVATTLHTAARLPPVPGYIRPTRRCCGPWPSWRSPGARTCWPPVWRTSRIRCAWSRWTPNTMPRQWCAAPVEKEGDPCERHTPEHAAELGRCSWAGSADRRICRGTPEPDDDRCAVHAA